MDLNRAGGVTPRQNAQKIERAYAYPQTPSSDNQSLQIQNIFTPDLSVDYRLLLLSLADEYINEARALTADIVYEQPNARPEQYYKLMATGMGCLGTVLEELTAGMEPRQEALIRLRYIYLLYEETNNDYVMDMQLQKAISFCERFRLSDLQCSMQHLQSRILFKTKPKAAFKYLDAVIHEAVTWQRTPWVYALRFVRISFSLQTGNAHEAITALQQARLLQDEAKKHGDHSVLAMAAIMEAYIHLRVHGVESITEAQRAIATARAALMSTSMTDQMELMIAMLEMLCTLDPYDHQQTKEKRNNLELVIARLQEEAETKQESSGLGSDNGSFLIPLEQSKGGSLTQETGGIFVKDASGRDYLTFSWYSQDDWHFLAFVLSIASVFPAQKNCLHYLGEAFRFDNEIGSHPISQGDSLAQAMQRSFSRRVLKCHLFMYMVLIKIDQSEWENARVALDSLHNLVSNIGSDVPPYFAIFVRYLQGIVNQATGQLDAALDIYSTPLMCIPSHNDHSATHIQTSISILAALNRLMVVSAPSHHLHHTAPSIFGALEKHFPSHSNKLAGPTTPSENIHLLCAYKFIQTIYCKELLAKKSLLQSSIQYSKQACNYQLVTITTAYLYDFMCKGIISQQNVNTVKGALKAARLAENRLWQCVATEQLADAFELEGNKAKVEQAREEALDFFPFLTGRSRTAEPDAEGDVEIEN